MLESLFNKVAGPQPSNPHVFLQNLQNSEGHLFLQNTFNGCFCSCKEFRPYLREVTLSVVYRAIYKNSSSEAIYIFYRKLPTMGFKSCQRKPKSLLPDFE